MSNVSDFRALKLLNGFELQFERSDVIRSIFMVLMRASYALLSISLVGNFGRHVSQISVEEPDFQGNKALSP